MLTLLTVALLTYKQEPIPPAPQIKRAESALKELLGAQYAAKTRPEKRAAALRFLEEAKAAAGADKYVLLRDAVSMASSAPDLRVAYDAVESLAVSFETKGDEARAKALSAAKRSATTTADMIHLGDQCLDMWERAMEIESFSEATFWAKEAEALAKAAKDASLAQATKDCAAEAAQSKEELAFLVSLEKQDSPLFSPTVSLHRGLYFVFAKGKLKEGWPLIAESGNAALAELAKKEISEPSTADECRGLAEGWMAAAKGADGALAKHRYAQRAAHWREESLARAQGLERSKLLRAYFPKVTVIKVTSSGAEEKPAADLTALCQESFDRDPRAPIIFDEYVFGSPITFCKSFTVEYECQGKRSKVTVAPKEAFTLPPASELGVIAPDASRRFRILSAHYGVGTKTQDYTERAKELFKTLDSEVLQVNFPEIAPGKFKTLAVVFERHGRRFIRWRREGDGPLTLR